MTTGRERMEYESGPTPEELRVRTREGRSTAYEAQAQGEHLKESVASGLHTAAERLRDRSREMGQPGLAGRVAEPLDRSAGYLGTHSLSQISHDANIYAREHPLVTAAGVFASAFLVGRLLRRR